ncbi:MAG: hypothetical protein RLW62_24245 [Gammaproteobacteria bacterium]
MSLLMDALRRAEQEKQRRAARAGAVAPARADDVPGDLSADLSGDAPGDGRGDAQDAAIDLEPPRYAGPDDVTVQVEPAAVRRASDEFERALREFEDADGSSEFEFAGDDGAPAPAADLSGGASDGAATGPPARDALALEPLDGATASAPAADDSAPLDTGTFGSTTHGVRRRFEQTATLPSARALNNDLVDYFDHSRETPRAAAAATDPTSAAMPPAGPPASDGVPEHTLEDVAAHTVVGAHTLFEASRRPRGNRLFQGIAVLAVLIVLGIGAVALFYAREQHDTAPLPSPLVADGVERAPARELPVVPLEPRASATPPPAATLTLAPATASATDTTTAPAPPAPVTAARDVPDGSAFAATAAAAAADASAPLVATAGSADSAASPAALASDADSAADPAAGAATAAVASGAAAPPGPARVVTPAPAAAEVSLLADVGVGEVRIARTRHAGGVEPAAAAAYAAYAAGDLATAAAGYRALLAGQPGRRDALLGLAAVALAAGDREAAFRHYATVLEQHPEDAVAAAALVSLTGGHGAATPARLRLLLDRHGELPYLHFALANWYARAGRWADAQQAYFEAWRRDEDNPDYAFNLAVSLDRIGQAGAALEYYRVALTLADAHSSHFDPAPALARIAALEAAAAVTAP